MIIFRKFRDNIGREQVKHHEEDIKAYLNMSPEEKEEFKKEIENRNNKKKELNKLGRETDKDIREAVKGSKVESKVGKILDKSEKEMKKAAQKEYAAISESGKVAKNSRDALEEARNLGYTKKAAVKAAKRILDRNAEMLSSFEKQENPLKPKPVRTRIGFKKDKLRDDLITEHVKDSRIGFRPDWTETKGSSVKLGFKKFSKQEREIVPADIVKKVKDGGGVIQKDHNGDWRIVSMKTKTNKSGMPEFWPQKSKDREDMVNILKSYQANKHK